MELASLPTQYIGVVEKIEKGDQSQCHGVCPHDVLDYEAR